jgi:hypothetical protein
VADEVHVITDAVLDEAKKWRDLSAKLSPIKGAVDGLTLDPSAFFVGSDPSFVGYSASYDAFQRFMSNVLAGGVTEFDQLGGALDKIAKEYDKADAIVSLDLNKIYTA